MPAFLRSRIVQDEAVTAAAAVRTDDLPVNPLSVILLTLRYRVTAAFAPASIANILGILSNVAVVYKGQNIITGSLADLAAVYYYLSGFFPQQGRRSDAAAAARGWITVPILLGRKPWDSKECFPAVRRGELQLQTTPAAAFTALDNVTLQIETLELLDATPERFLKYTTFSKTPTVAGEHDMDLPIGNPILDIVLFSTTVPTDAAELVSINQAKLLLDNVEYGYALTNWESMKGHEALDTVADWQSAELTSRLAAGAPAGDAATEAAEWGTAFLRQYAHLPMGPRGMEDHWLITEGRARVHLRIDAGDTNAVRMLPIEVLAVGGTARAAA